MSAVHIALEARSVSKTYYTGSERAPVLKNVSVLFYEHEFIAIMGPSGSGKTTLAHVLGGLLKPDSGDVWLDSKVLKRSDKALSRYRNQQIGFVFQDFNLLGRLSVLDNVAVPLMIAKMSLARRRERALECLGIVGLAHKAAAQASDLSGGERQRVAIARALSNDPRIIIADEPTGSLDSANGVKILDILKSLVQDRGVTVITITHDERVARHADRVLHIIDGSIKQMNRMI